MDYRSIFEALRLKQKAAPKRIEETYFVNIRYVNYQWVVTRHTEDGVEVDFEKHNLQGAARYVARTWMDMHNVTRIYCYTMKGKVKEVIMAQDKAV